jgi:hypothetical protein
MLLIALALLILGGSGLFYYTRIVQPAQLQARAQATALASTSSTTQLYVTATNGTPDLDSSLNLNDPSWNWVEYAGSQSGSCVFREGAYYSTVTQKGSYSCLAQGTDVSNFAYQVQMTIVTGDKGGLIFRSDNIDQNSYPFSTNYYFLSISHNGDYNLYYHSDKPPVQLASGSDSAIKMGLNQPNLLTVIARGSNISVYVNKHYITSVSDSTRGSGLVGVFALSNGNPTDVRFSNAQQWSL